MNIYKDYSLKSSNTFSIDVTASYFIEVDNIDEIKEILTSKEFKLMPFVILGGGSNVLLTKDFNGIVLQLKSKNISKVEKNDDYVLIEADAGVVWNDLVNYCVSKNYGGIENLSLIPGSVGASPIQNIGAYGQELKDTLFEVKGLNLVNFQHEVLTNDDCKFGYRSSIFKNELKNQFIISSIILKLKRDPVVNISYGSIKDELCKLDKTEYTIKDVSDAVVNIRQSKIPDTKVFPNSGSFFKNPEITEEDFNIIKEKYQDIPSFRSTNGFVKIPAGWLIEQCGWKGKRIGDVGCYEKQALIIVNFGNAKGQDILEFAAEIKSDVLQKFNISLLEEVNII